MTLQIDLNEKIEQSTDKLFSELLSKGLIVVDPSSALEAARDEVKRPLYRFDQKTPEDWAEMRQFMTQVPRPPFRDQWAEVARQKAELVSFEAPNRDSTMRIIRPAGQPRGVLLYLHGSGFVGFNTEFCQDKYALVAEQCGLLVGAPEYRKGPEEPYPAGIDDAEAGAIWLREFARREYGMDDSPYFVWGDSSGGNFAAALIYRMNHKHGIEFSGALLDEPILDLTNSMPSQYEWDGSEEPMDSVTIQQEGDNYVTGNENRRDPDISPLFGNPQDWPVSLFTATERDAVKDHALLMNARILASGGESYLIVWRGIGHVFGILDCPEMELDLRLYAAFLNHLLDRV